MNILIKNIPLVIFFLFVGFLLFYFGIRGVVYSDEGYILETASRIFKGEVPYKDFHFVYTPLSAYITAFSFFLFGQSVLSGRLLMVGVSFLTSIYLLLIFQRLEKNTFFPLLGVLLYILWAPLHANFPWPVFFSLCFGVISIYFLLPVKNAQKRNLLFSGFFAFLVFLTKQNFGIGIVLVFLLSFVFSPQLRKKQYFGLYLLGFLIPFLLYIFYLIMTGSFKGFISDFWVYTIQRIVFEQTLTTPFIYGSTLSEKIAKILFYTTPLLLGVISFIFCFFKKKEFICLPLFVILFYLLGIRPTTDYIHLTPLLSLLGIPLILLWKSNIQILRIISFAITSIFIFLGFYSALFRGYYRWEPPLTIQNQFLTLPKTFIILDEFHKKELEQLVNAIQTRTQKQDGIFVSAYQPIIYFIADRKNATGFDLIESTEFYNVSEKEIVYQLKSKKTKIVITIGVPGKNFLGEYIKKEYNKADTINAFIVWQKK